MSYLIAPSILSANFARLGEEVRNVLAAGADCIHFDVMDNHYVPNLTVGPVVCEALRQEGITAPIDVHLMVEDVDSLTIAFAKAGASSIVFHPEASRHIDRSLDLIRSHGLLAGLAFNPATPFNYLDYVADKIDIILMMSVNPGFGGQSFIPSALDKIKEVRHWLNKNHLNKVRLAVDGGVQLSNIAQIAAAGANEFIAGSSIFKAKEDYQHTIAAFRAALAKV
ncbi:MAG: ribulose-phosphate 3-epimerase [Gammaproteobacteria bacterium]|nr:ribulose-phosphate 3-epimerase [Gammaproteobacteria bacterium]